MTRLLIPCSGSSGANFGEKISVKSAYSLGTSIRVSFAFRRAISAFFKGYLSLPKFILRAAMYTIKASCFSSRTAAVNSFFLISLTCLVVESIFPVV